MFHIFFLFKIDLFTLIQIIWKQQDDEDCEFEIKEIVDQYPGKYLIK